MKDNVAASACLLGECCRYDRKSSLNDFLLQTYPNIIKICPEILAGMDVPRVPVEIVGGDGYDVLKGNAKIITKTGEDVTKIMINGAQKALDICLTNNIKHVFLKSKSPSCGCSSIYDGTFNSKLKSGIGLFVALLKINGINVTEID